jgi:hypothetical protein
MEIQKLFKTHESCRFNFIIFFAFMLLFFGIWRHSISNWKLFIKRRKYWKKEKVRPINKCDETVHQQQQSLEDLKIENLNLKKKMVAKKKSISKLNNELNSVNALIDKFFQ